MIRLRRRYASLITALTLVASVSSACRPAPKAAAPTGLDLAGMDSSVAPGDNFFTYSNGTWLKDTPIPPDRSSYGSGAILVELTSRRVVDLIQEASKANGPAGSDLRKIGDYYASFMDTAAIEAAGLKPLQPAFDAIAAIGDRKGLARVLGTGLRADVDALNATNFYTDKLFGLWVAQDLDDPTHYLPFLLQGGLEMPDRSYYLDPSPSMVETRAAYQKHVAAMLTLAGISNPDARAAGIFRLETRMAQVHASREASEDVLKANNHWTRKDFGTKAPGLDWDTYFTAAGLGGQAGFVVWHPSAVTGLSALVASQPLDAWKDYLTYHAIEARTAVLPAALDQESFGFFGKVLSGAQKQRDRWKRGVSATNGALGFVVGKLYVQRYFPPEEKARAQAMVANIIAAFSERIDHLDWMAPSTKAEAKAKLAVLKVGVGYPDTWPDYTGLEIRAGDPFGNAERADLFQTRKSLERLGQPVDRGEWVMTPQTVNAVNLPAMNAMNFPAAILQPPYFDPNRPLVMDYGAIGATIGHEVSHSFDNSGALFDSQGRLHDWWTPEDFKHFEASSTQLVKQYDGYRPFPDLAVNGKQTLGENIADVAGLAAAYDAYQRSLDGKPAPVVDGFSGDQQFFISFAQSWRQKEREPSLRNGILTDGHSPDEYRALTVRNLDAWYTAFNIQAGQTLYLAQGDRVKVW